MAKIDEEQILLRFSLLIRDEANVTDTTITTTTIREDLEAYAQGLVEATGLPIIVEADFVSNVQVSP